MIIRIALVAVSLASPAIAQTSDRFGPDDIARLYWDFHTGREPAEHLISA